MAQRVQIAIDCQDPHALADFWAAILGYTIPGGHDLWTTHSTAVATYPGEAWVRIVDPEDRGPRLLFHSVPEAKTIKNRLHLDVRAPDDGSGDRRQRVAAFVETAISLGAQKVRDVVDEDGYFAVLQDPEGNEFCIGAGD